MKKVMMLMMIAVTAIQAYAQHNAGNNGKVLMIASNPGCLACSGMSEHNASYRICHVAVKRRHPHKPGKPKCLAKHLGLPGLCGCLPCVAI